MAKGVIFYDRDKGYARLLAQAASMKGIKITVGIHAEEGSASYAGGMTLADVAAVHEFGSGRVPQRSFLRAYVDERMPVNKERLKKAAEVCLRKGLDIETAFDVVGLKMVGEIQARISAGIPPPLSPRTIARKGSDVPLIDTGLLRSSIKHKVMR